MKRIFLTSAIMAVCCAFLPSCVTHKAETFHFIQISDPQIGFKDSTLEKSTAWLAETVAKINELHPDFVVCTGDMTHIAMDERQTRILDSLFAGIDSDIPLYTVPGNHDYRVGEWPGTREFYAEHFGENRFSFMHKGTLMIGYDTNIIKEDLTDEEEEQYAWLRGQLDKYRSKAEHIIVFQHCPVIARDIDEKEGYSNFQAPYRQKYLDLFAKYGVDAVLAGHKHGYFYMRHGDIDLVACPACGVALGKNPDGSDKFRGLNVVKVTPEAVEWRATPIDRAVLF